MSGHFNQGLRNRPPRVVTLADGRPLPPVGKVTPAAALTEDERENRWERMEREWNESAEHVRKSREAWAEWLEKDV
jgi:hypothetical protein